KPILKAITQPLLIIHAEKDEVAPIKNVELVKKLTSSKKIETLILKNSLHVITMDYEKEICANTTANFLQKF
ncbi:carboxylesterase, partial [bacterium]|nr:carboxylesterase [bacterium]